MHCPSNIESTVTRTSKVWLGEGGILHMRFLASNFTFADAKTDFTWLSTLKDPTDYLIVDFSKLKTIKKDGKDFLSGHDLTKSYKAIAVIRKQNFISKLLIGGKFLAFHPETETKIFENYNDAKKWIDTKING